MYRKHAEMIIFKTKNFLKNLIFTLFYIFPVSAFCDGLIEPNVPDFKRVWKFEIDAKDMNNTVQAQPKEFQDLILLVDGEGHFLALDKHTGALVYRIKLGEMAGRRGFAVDYEAGHIAIVASDYTRVGLEKDGSLFLLDALTGNILNKFPTNWSVVEPVITPECIITFGARNGIIQCHSRANDNVLWRTELGNRARIWSNPLVSQKHNMIYLVTSDSGDIVGGARKNDIYSSSLIGLNAKTGKVVFFRKMIKDGVWDFDGVGRPILVENFINDNRQEYDLIIGFNKTGTVFAVNALDGSPVKKDQFKDVLFANNSELKPELANLQTIPTWPIRVSDISLIKSDLRLQKARPKILRHVKYGEFIPPNLDFDVITRGLHGGPQNGGEHFRYAGEDFLAVPYNNNSWILRLNYIEDFWFGSKIYSVLLRLQKVFEKAKSLFVDNKKSKAINNEDIQAGHRWIQTKWSDSNDRAQKMDVLYKWIKKDAYHESYSKNCAECHRNDRGGRFESELEGDGYVPGLVGYTLTEKYEYGKDYLQLMSIHDDQLNVSEEVIRGIFEHFDQYDRKKLRENKLQVTGFWQSLLGTDGLPLNKGPWGGVAIINLNSGEKVGDITVGQMLDDKGNLIDGSVIFGGLGRVTDKQESLLVGTVDAKAYYVNLRTGAIIQTIDLERSGSVQPYLTEINGCEAWVIVETGGRYSFFDREKNGYTIEAFVNKSSCNLSMDGI
jgi:outer membrane protein assembly factor BamB